MNWKGRAGIRLKANAHRDVRIHVGATAATEHLTAIFAEWMLSHPEALVGAEKRLQTLWLWHSAEESEHRSTAFDIYKAMGGSEEWRIKIFRYITITLSVGCDTSNHTQPLARRQPLPMEHVAQCLSFAVGHRTACSGGTTPSGKTTCAPDFHPRQQDATFV